MLCKFFLNQNGHDWWNKYHIWKICAYETPALNIVPGPQKMCGKCWPVLVSLQE